MKKNNAFEQIENFVQRGKALGLEVGDIEEKLQRVKAEEDTIKIVLLGSVSEGKTSTIAALLGKVKEDMKIDPAESSDEIVVYKTRGLDSNVEIIDTPGLFGTKEKEVSGETLKYSDITKRYITEAHLVLYVCNAVNPLKDSHKDALHLVLRDYGKLDSTIFVVNGMDGLGFDITDREEYLHNAKIKQAVVVERLKHFIDLTPQEEKKLSIVCVSADPKGKGLQYWMEDENKEKYQNRSNIVELKNATKNKLAEFDKVNADDKIVKATSLDIVKRLAYRTEALSLPMEKNLNLIREKLDDTHTECDIMKEDLLRNKKMAKEELIELQTSILADISGASVETFGKMIDSTIGTNGKEITGFIVQSRASSIIENCGQHAQQSVEMRTATFKTNFDDIDKFSKELLKGGVKWLGKTTVTGKQVLKFRDTFAKSFKFKPWGAIKMGKNVTKGLKVGGAVLSGFIEAWSVWKTFKETKKVKKAKELLKESIGEYFKEVLELFDSDETYYKNFAPSYLDLVEIINSQQQKINELEGSLTSLNQYNDSLKQWLKGEGAEYVDYEEI